MAKIKGESELTFMEAASIIVGTASARAYCPFHILPRTTASEKPCLFCLSATQLRLFCIF